MEPATAILRPKGMTASVRAGLALFACGLVSACAGTAAGGSTMDDGRCVSHYENVARAPTWAGLEVAMLADQDWGHVASVRTQLRGGDVGAGNEHAVRVVDLLDRDGRRLVQADVWRSGTGDWRAGVWSQCTD